MPAGTRGGLRTPGRNQELHVVVDMVAMHAERKSTIDRRDAASDNQFSIRDVFIHVVQEDPRIGAVHGVGEELVGEAMRNHTGS